MESKQQTPSVILKLMGLDKVPRQHHLVRDRQKVLSEDYLQKVASIGVTKKRSSHQHHSFDKEECDDVLKVTKTIRRDKNHSPSKGNGKENPSLYETMVEGVPQLKNGTFKSTISVSKVNPGKGGIGLKYSSFLSSCKSSHLADGLLKEIFHPRSMIVYPEAKSKTLEQSDVTEKLQEDGKHGQDSTHQQLPVIYQHGKGARNFSHQSGFSNGKFERNIRCKVGVNYSFARKVSMTRPLIEASAIADNCETMTKDDLFQKYWGLRKNASTNRSIQKLKNRNISQKDCSEDVNIRSSSEKSPSFSSYFNSNDTEENCIDLHKLKKRCYGNDLSNKKPMFSQMSKQSAVSPNSSVDWLVSDAKTEVVGWSHNNPTKMQSESMVSVMTHRDSDSLSHTSYASRQQDTSESQEDYAHSICSGVDPDSLSSFQVAYEPSPISVLDPTFREDISVISECGAGVYDSSEVDDEGLGLNVSSDEDCGNESVGDFAEKKDIVGISRTEESRDFSYAVEVLTEARISNTSLFKDFSTWHTAEFPISPSIFEILEKKFGEQQHWKTSERRLLFNRINLGLLEILQPYLYIPNWEKPVSRRVIVEPSQDMIEEEIWGLLVSQEKKAGKESADDMLGGEIRWIELGEDVEDIVREIVKLLIEDLADEIVSLENF